MEWIYLIIVAIIAFVLSYITRCKPKIDLRPIDFFLVNSKTFDKLKGLLDCLDDNIFQYNGYNIQISDMVQDGQVYVVYKQADPIGYSYNPYINPSL